MPQKRRMGNAMTMPNMPAAANPSGNLDIIMRLERLSRQTSLVALETALEAAEDGALGRRLENAVSARNVAMHIIRASVEMQQAARLYG